VNHTYCVILTITILDCKTYTTIYIMDYDSKHRFDLTGLRSMSVFYYYYYFRFKRNINLNYSKIVMTRTGWAGFIHFRFIQHV
jgi:hypothetical protein